MSDLPELDPEAVKLLQAERDDTSIPSGVEARVLQHLEAVLGPSSSWPSHPLPVAQDPSSLLSEPPTNPVVAPPSSPWLRWASKPFLSAFFGFLLGAGTHAALGPSAKLSAVAQTERPPSLSSSLAVPLPASGPPASSVIELPASSSVPAPLASVVLPLSSATVSAVASAVASPMAEIPGRTSLAAEQTLLDIARAALVRGQPDAALETLQRHSTRFPAGVLREERESLRIQALAASGRQKEAQEKMSAFKKQFPDSLQKDALEQVAIPSASSSVGAAPR